MLNADDKRFLLDLARNAIENYLKIGQILEVDEKTVSEAVKGKAPCFVTLTIEGELRGCIGTTEPTLPLYQNVLKMAIAAAFEDPRFPALTVDELPKIHVEISILKDFKRVDGADYQEKIFKILPGRDGVILENGTNRALFLPQVWNEVGSKDEFYSLLSRKAGMESRGWMEADTDFTVFEVEKFE